MKFEDEYILATGWPGYHYGLQNLQMFADVEGNKKLKLKYPIRLNSSDCPEYTLMLRRVKNERDKI